jgi:hypothetical protein
MLQITSIQTSKLLFENYEKIKNWNSTFGVLIKMADEQIAYIAFKLILNVMRKDMNHYDNYLTESIDILKNKMRIT